MGGSRSASIPGLLSRQRFATLISSLLVALSSGTNYVYSAYAPQLGSRLGISHTRLNVIGLAGNVGVYSSGPFWGKLVDRRGPRLLFIGAFIFLLTGYSGVRHFYDAAGSSFIANPISSMRRDELDNGIPILSFCVLVFCSFLTGLGGNAGLTASVNATAKSFPDQMRASTTGLVLSGFGLSAFFFSTMAHIIFPGDTSLFLLVLSLGTSLPMVAGFFLVRPIPIPPPEGVPPAERRTSFTDMPHDGFARTAGVDGVLDGDTVVYERTVNSHTHLLAGHPVEEESEFLHRDHDTSGAVASSRSVELALSPAPSGRRHRSRSGASGRRSASRVIEIMQELHGKALLMSSDFWLLFSILSLLSGTGLMYINNVGSISQALFAMGNPDYDEVEATKWQSMQVSTISIANFSGRILVGLGADFVKNKLRAPRSYCLTAVAALFILSQVTATTVGSAAGLWKASALLGLAYGGAFGLFPTLCIEWFGLTHLSENWGFVSLSPMVGGNLFSLAFGRNFDRHAEAPAPAAASPALLARAAAPPSRQCFEGRQCYVSSLYMTVCACSVALALSVYAGWRDRRRMTVVDTRPDVIWEESEDS